jgi:hypothetical protein
VSSFFSLALLLLCSVLCCICWSWLKGCRWVLFIVWCTECGCMVLIELSFGKRVIFGDCVGGVPSDV